MVLRHVNANATHTPLNSQRQKLQPFLCLDIQNSSRGLSHGVILNSISQYLNTLNWQWQWQSRSKMSFRAPCWALLSASFSSLVHAAYCAPASPVSVEWEGNKENIDKRKQKVISQSACCALFTKCKQMTDKTSFFRQRRMALSISLHVPKNFRTLC